MQNHKTDFITGIIFTAFSMFYLIVAYNIPEAGFGVKKGHIYFPIFVGVIALIGGLGLTVKEYILWKNTKKDNSGENKKEGIFLKEFSLIGVTLVLGFIYVYFFDKVGFIISTTLFLATLLFILRGKNKWLSNILIPLIFSLAIYYTFGELLSIHVPTLFL